MILPFDTGRMKDSPPESQPESSWQKTNYANLIRYVPSRKYYARVRIKGKLIVRSLKTDVLSVAKLRLNDLEKKERQRVELTTPNITGRMTFQQAIEKHKLRLAGDLSLKPRTKQYHQERITALLVSWPGLDSKEIRAITKTECLDWAATFGKDISPTNFNHTIGILRKLFEIGIEAGVRYDNPARHIMRVKERNKRLKLPEATQFKKLVQSIAAAGSRHSRHCANLVMFLAYGGFRKSEAANIKWQDCDFEKQEIIVRGDPETGTKNWSIRRVPMIPDMVDLLTQIKAKTKNFSPDSPVMTVREAQKSIDSACIALKIQRITHHDLRHLFATRCIEAGVDIPTVARWMGHKDGGALAMKTYGHLRNEHSQAMAAKVKF